MRCKFGDVRWVLLPGLTLVGLGAGCADWPGLVGSPGPKVAGETVVNDDPSQSGSSGPTDSTTALNAAPADSGAAAAAAVPSLLGDANTGSVSGTLGAGEYRLYPLGASDAGDQWTVSLSGLTSYVVVLFEADSSLVRREMLSGGKSFAHVMRRATTQTYAGIMPIAGGLGGAFRLDFRRQAGSAVPESSPQIVYLNFAGASGLSIHHQAAISFDAFDAADIGDEYAGQTQPIKQAILSVVRRDYAPYNVTIVSSDDAAPPADVHATVHFGGNSDGLLGLADSVDNYNQDPAQAAIVYIEAFQPYWTMKMTPAQQGVMIGNVASHELGHLLGLYHTQDPSDVLDTTGTAWQLAGTQNFELAPLEPTVFATGSQNSPLLLSQIVGLNPSAAKASASKSLLEYDGSGVLKQMVMRQMGTACGTCRHLDD